VKLYAGEGSKSRVMLSIPYTILQLRGCFSSIRPIWCSVAYAWPARNSRHCCQCCLNSWP